MQKFDPITPNDIAPMSISFAEFLADYADTIATATVTAAPVGLTITQVTNTADEVRFIAKQGAVGSYVLTFHIVTAGGAEWHRNAGLTVKASI